MTEESLSGGQPKEKILRSAQDDSPAEKIPRFARNDNDVSPLSLSGQQKNQNTNRAVAASSGNSPVSLPAQVKGKLDLKDL